MSWWLIGDGHWAIGGSPVRPGAAGPDRDDPGRRSIVLLGAAVVWWGPLSLMTRIGARRVLAVVAPGRTGALVATVVLLAVSAIFVALILTGAAITWAPLPSPTLP